MKTMFRAFLLTAVIFGSLLALRPVPASADDYWGGYWGWYDGTYRPYYTRQYSYYGPTSSYYAPTPAPAYGYSYGPGYYGTGPAYYGTYGPAYSGYGYAAPYRTYYGVPGAGVNVVPGGAAVRVGPARIGWR